MDASTDYTVGLLAELRAVVNDLRLMQALSEAELRQNRQRMTEQLTAMNARLSEIEDAVDAVREKRDAPGFRDAVSALIGAIVRAILHTPV